MHAGSANVSPARCHRLRLHTGRSISTSQDQRTLARRATVFHSTRSLDDGAIAVPSNALYQHWQLSLLLHLLSRSNQTLGRASPHTTRPIHPASCLLISTLPNIRAIGSELRLQGRSNLAARGVTCACHAHVHVATTRAACVALILPSLKFADSSPFLVHARSGCFANPYCRATA
jgi:hypothetical protein